MQPKRPLQQVPVFLERVHLLLEGGSPWIAKAQIVVEKVVDGGVNYYYSRCCPNEENSDRSIWKAR